MAYQVTRPFFPKRIPNERSNLTDQIRNFLYLRPLLCSQRPMDELNFRVADALVSMPKHKESAFSVVAGEVIDPVIFVRRFQTLPDSGPQVYAINPETLGKFKAYDVKATFTYTLCVSPMAPRSIEAVVLNTAGADPLVEAHAPEFADLARGCTVLHFTDADAMRGFVGV